MVVSVAALAVLGGAGRAVEGESGAAPRVRKTKGLAEHEAVEPPAMVAAEPTRAPTQAHVVLTDTPGSFAGWARARPEERARNRGLVRELKAGNALTYSVWVEGYRAPESRHVDLTADIVVLDPKGNIFFERVSSAQRKGTSGEPVVHVFLYPSRTLSLGPTDLPGTYTVKATVWDQIRGVAHRAEAKFDVTP